MLLGLFAYKNSADCRKVLLRVPRRHRLRLRSTNLSNKAWCASGKGAVQLARWPILRWRLVEWHALRLRGLYWYWWEHILRGMVQWPHAWSRPDENAWRWTSDWRALDAKSTARQSYRQACKWRSWNYQVPRWKWDHSEVERCKIRWNRGRKNNLKRCHDTSWYRLRSWSLLCKR